MNSARFSLSYLFLAVLTTACKEAPADPNRDRLASVSALQAFSADSTTVGLAWTATTATNTGYMADHEIIVRAGEQILQTLNTPNSATSYSVFGLTEGVVYTFELTVRANETSPYLNSQPVTIAWSPAKRLTSDAGTGAPLRLYESDSPGNMHALRLYSDSAKGARLVSLSSVERAEMDVYLLSAPVGVRLRSGDLYAQSPAGKETKFSERIPVSASSLDNPQPFAPGLETYSLDEVNIPTESVQTGLIFFARTADNHYVRILVLRGANNRLIEGTASNRYITVQLSYQSVAGIQYAHYEGDSRVALPALWVSRILAQR